MRLSVARAIGRATAVAILLAVAAPSRAQEAPAPDAPTEAAPSPDPDPKPRPKPKPPAKPKPAAAPKPKPAEAKEPVVKEAAPMPDPAPPAQTLAPVTPAANLPGLTVSCDGKAALYEAPNAFAVWVTRSGAIIVENPLRPLTPETTRVLQVVIAGKAATAYGPDLFALRRGGSPAALEATVGGALRWDAAMTPLPDTLAIVSEAGAPLASLAFRECGEAPAVAAAPSAAKAKKPQARGAAKVSATPKAPPGFQLPQGAIP